MSKLEKMDSVAWSLLVSGWIFFLSYVSPYCLAQKTALGFWHINWLLVLAPILAPINFGAR